MLGFLSPTLIAVIASVAIGFGSGWTINGMRLGAEISHMQTQAAINLSNSLKDALDQTVKFQRTKDEALQKAERRALDNSRSAIASRAESDRLRNLLAANASSIDRATHASLQSYASTLSDVYGECVSKYQALGAEADKYTSDLRTLTDAWPK